MVVLFKTSLTVTASLPLETCFTLDPPIDRCSNQSLSAAENYHEEKLPLYFLVMAPYPDNPPLNPSWKGGPAVVPAAILAKELINEREDILRDYRLEFIIHDSGCNQTSKAVDGFIRSLFYSNKRIVGIIGGACSEATRAIAPLVPDERVSLIQIAPSATSPDFTNTTHYPNTFRPIVSALGVVDTYIEILRRMNYRHVGALYEADRPFQTNVYTRFLEEALIEEVKVTAFGLFDRQIPVSEFHSKLKVIFVFASPDFASQLLCLAYHEGMLSPDYQFIFSNRRPRNFFKNVTVRLTDEIVRCDPDQMKESVVGMIFSDFRLTRRDRTETKTHAGISYDEFNQSYTEVRNCHLAKCGLQSAISTEHQSSYFDATWSLALSLNNSQPRLKEMGLSLSDYTYLMPQITSIIREELLNLSFEGMRGRVEFSRVTHDGANVTIIDIYQYLNISEVYSRDISIVGEYDPSMMESPLKFHENASLLTTSEFDLHYVVPHISFGILVAVASGFLLLILITCHVAYFAWRKYKTVKASSPRLNHLMFTGCYLAVGGTIVYINSFVFIHISENPLTMMVFALHCTALQWATTLMYSLIFGTLCVKTWRVYCIFYKYNSLLVKHLNDKVLFLIALLPLALDIVMNILWNVVDLWYFDSRQVEGYDLLALANCKTSNEVIWIIATAIPKGVLTVFVLYLAASTRRVHRKEFKETKSINILIFGLLLLAGTCLPIWVILRETVIESWHVTVSDVCFCLWLLGSVLLCIVFLFFPPLIPVIKHKIQNKRTTSLSPLSVV